MNPQYPDIRKPLKPFKADPPDPKNIYFNSRTETESSFRWYAEKVNFLTEMMKFLPNIEMDLYMGVDKEVLLEDATQFGNDMTHSGDAFYATDANGNDVYNNPWDYDPNNPATEGKQGRGYTVDAFGVWHRNPDGRGGIWGSRGAQIAENINLKCKAGEYNHFKNVGKYSDSANLANQDNEGNSINNALSATEYASRTGIAGTDYSREGDFLAGGQQIVRSTNIWNKADNEVSGLGRDGKTNIAAYKLNKISVMDSQKPENTLGMNWSYYEVMMSGFRQGGGATITKIKDKPVEEPLAERVVWGSESGFVYDSWSNEQAFMYMTGMVESRRRIFSALSELFGDWRNIIKVDPATSQPTPDSLSMISTFDQWQNTYKVDPHNASLFMLFYQAEHSLSSVLPAFSSPEGGQGFMFSGRDELATKRFAQAMKDKTLQYMIEEQNEFVTAWNGSIVEGSINMTDDQIKRSYGYLYEIENIRTEYFGKLDYNPSKTLAQPYMNGEIGWDKFCKPWTVGVNDPTDINPGALGHSDYIQPQINYLDSKGNLEDYISYRDPYNIPGDPNSGSKYVTNDHRSLMGVNWAAHHFISLQEAESKDYQRTWSIRIGNRKNYANYKKAKKKYDEDTFERLMEDAKMNANIMAKIAAERNREQMAINRAANQAAASRKTDMKMAEVRKKENKQKRK